MAFSMLNLRMSLFIAAGGVMSSSQDATGPQFSWDTLPVFFHCSNASGQVNAESLKFLAKYQMVTIDKFQGLCANTPDISPDCDEESQIVEVLKGVKAINPNTTTLFYLNSVLNFPQYRLNGIMSKEAKHDPTVLVHDAAGKLARLPHKGTTLTAFNFSNPRTRELWMEVCVNATRTGAVDGCFADRACDGDSGSVQHEVNLTTEQAEAYTKGHVQVLMDVQRTLGSGPLIANHAWGPPHDAFVPGAVSFAMVESFHANNKSIQELLTGVGHKRGMQVHVKKASRDALAAFLIGAGHRSYFGLGEWSSTADSFEDHWMPEFDLPLGKPLGDAVYNSTDRMWRRRFQHINVTFSVKTGKGVIEGWNPSPAPPAPTPLPQPTQQCPEIFYGGYHNDSLAQTAAESWATCCDDCASHPSCAHWSWSEATAPLHCHLHGSGALHPHNKTGRISGTVARVTGVTVV